MPIFSKRGEMDALRTAFSSFLGSKPLEEVLQSDPLTTVPAEIEFILVLLNDTDLDRVSDIAARTVDLVAKHNEMVLGFDASLIVIGCGLFPRPDSGGTGRPSLAAALHAELSTDACVLHGAAQGRRGTIGSNRRMSWTVVLPNFKALLAQLCALEYGQIAEAR
jgi:hypothetical protein